MTFDQCGEYWRDTRSSIVLRDFNESTVHKGGSVVTIKFAYPAILDLFPQHLDSKRSQSASFLIWYLENYYRLDTQTAIDSVCDQRGDKGVDGIFVNDNDETITIFQNTISQKSNTTIGDKSLREFAGTLTQFKNSTSIKSLINAAGKNLLASLVKRLDLETKITTYKLRGEFVTNTEIDANGQSFLDSSPNLTFIGKKELLDAYISDSRDAPIDTKATFDIVGFSVAEYALDADTKAIIAPVKATELVKLSGINNQSLFTYNLRGPLGKTGVNKDIVKSIGDKKRHRQFPLFHNGITIIAKKLNYNKDEISIHGYFVVNGCQSLSSFFGHKEKLTDDLRILAKFVQMEPTSDLAKLVTEFSNNQNGIKLRDFMANNTFQIRLQQEFSKNYKGQYAFEIKRGDMKDAGTEITNEEAGLLLWAFDLKEPWATHRKYQVFDDKYRDLFARKEVTADRIVLCRTIADSIDSALPTLANSLLSKYVLTRYMLMYCIRNILERDALWAQINKNPQVFIRDEKNRQHFRKCIDNIMGDLKTDVDAEIEADVEISGIDFDYRGKLRDAAWVKNLAKKVVSAHIKMVTRKNFKSFKDDWEAR